jgi:hypothetical protein
MTEAYDASLEQNRRTWDIWSPVHSASSAYNIDRFVVDPEHLSGVVRFDQPRLPDLTGINGLHLHCHIGTDTISLARLGAIDQRHSDHLVVGHSYFERAEPRVIHEGGSYVDTDQEPPRTVTHEWNHGLGEIITALLEQGMELTGLVEHDSVPWEAIAGQMSCDDRGEWRLSERPWRLAASYTLQARRVSAPSAHTAAG